MSKALRAAEKNRPDERAFPEHVPVLIVGAGPIGLGLACDLGWREVSCLIVEQGESTARIPRTNAIGVRTMEFCRRWGIADDVRAAGVPADYPHTFMYVTGLAGHLIARVNRSTHGGSAASPVSPERAQRCNQLWFDPVLRRRAAGFPSVSVRYRCRFESFARTADGLVATLVDLANGQRVQVSTDYLIACCGGRSAIREQLAIQVEGIPTLGYPVDIYFRVPQLWACHDKGKAAMYYITGPEGVWANLEALNGIDYWRLTVHGGKDPVDLASFDAEACLRRAIQTDVPCEILAITPWVRRSVVARSYGSGCVFLAGDCAHQNPPDGGFGMNTGMGDAVDLGWKLEAMIKGWGGSRLLDSYETERRPVAQRAVAAAMKRIERRSIAVDETLCDVTLEGEASRRRVREQIEAIGALFNADGIALGYRYEGSPICWPEDTPAPPDDTTRYVPTTRSGARAPHAWLEDGSSLIDFFGRGFVLLCLGASAPEIASLADAARRRGVPFRVVEPDSAAIHELYARRLVLVRPDGHVAWRSDTLPPDVLALIDRVRGAAPA